jgi:uncharacterized protein YcnI
MQRTASAAGRRTGRRVVTVALAALAGVLVIAAPAAAHTEIELDNPTAGASNVTLSVNAEAESEKAGIASVAVQLPPGLAPAQVSLVSGPAGWALTPTADGYQVAGAALKTGVDAAYKVKIARLPDTPGPLTFKTVVTYGNGDSDSWIGAAGSDNPAPVVTLAAGTPTPAASGVPSTAPSTLPSSPPGPAFNTPGASQPANDGGWPSWATWLIALVVLVAAVITVLVLRRRRPGNPPTT